MQPVGRWRCEKCLLFEKNYGSHFALFPINPVCCSAGCNDHRLAEQAGNQNISFCLDSQIVVLLLVKAKVISKSMFHSTLRFWTCLTWNLSAASIRVCVNKNDCVNYLQQHSSADMSLWKGCVLCRVGRSSNSVYTGRFQVVKVKVIKIKAVLYKTCRALWYISISCNNIFSHNKEVYVACWWKSYDPNKLDVCFLIIFPWTSMIH